MKAPWNGPSKDAQKGMKLPYLNTSLAGLTNWVKTIHGMNRNDFASQRMCPFCGLITPRRKSCCLECGKVLKAA